MGAEASARVAAPAPPRNCRRHESERERNAFSVAMAASPTEFGLLSECTRPPGTNFIRIGSVLLEHRSAGEEFTVSPRRGPTRSQALSVRPLVDILAKRGRLSGHRESLG